jgi:hypothetical protein
MKKIFYIVLSICKSFCFIPFPPFISGSAPPILRHSADPPFCEIACHNQKKLLKIQENVKKLYGDKALKRMQISAIKKKAKEGETGGESEASQRKGFHYQFTKRNRA